MISVEVSITFWYLCPGVSFFWQICAEPVTVCCSLRHCYYMCCHFSGHREMDRTARALPLILYIPVPHPFLLFLGCPCGPELRPEPGRSSCLARNWSREATLDMKKNNKAWVTESDVKSWGKESGRVPSARVRTATSSPRARLTPRNLLAGFLSFPALHKTRAPPVRACDPVTHP